ncbi:hypothetical protein ACRALDRAFT_205646 [Sodiomyces alcalophilus JCM 7366]|uniref:uncharacterized protein n=1 Tax=Sodiomyces alcalophilus JCM 7366 TaxID=591952 RepID=UPI0039B45367
MAAGNIGEILPGAAMIVIHPISCTCAHEEETPAQRTDNPSVIQTRQRENKKTPNITTVVAIIRA